MARKKPEKRTFQVFLDTSALFAGIWSSTGGGRMILKLAEAGVASIEFMVSSQVLSELEEVLRKKSPEVLGYLAALLDRCQITVISEVTPEILVQSCKLVSHPGDARILAEAWTAGVDFLATLDRKHFLDNEKLREAVPFVMGTPGDFLAWFRKLLLTNIG